jgi:hypothetical protein
LSEQCAEFVQCNILLKCSYNWCFQTPPDGRLLCECSFN